MCGQYLAASSYKLTTYGWLTWEDVWQWTELRLRAPSQQHNERTSGTLPSLRTLYAPRHLQAYICHNTEPRC